MAEKKITKQGLSKAFMVQFLEDGLKNKTITKKAFSDWKKAVKKIESGEGTKSEHLKQVKETFYTTFISPSKSSTGKSNHPLFDLFDEIGKEEPNKKDKKEPVKEDKVEE